MMQGNLALKLDDFEEDYCYPYIVEDCEQNLPDNIIQFPERDVAEVDPNTGEVTITRKRPTHTYGPSIVKGNINDLPEGVGTEENPASTVALADITDDYTDQSGSQTIYKTDRSILF